jgi:hypothetical protein
MRTQRMISNVLLALTCWAVAGLIKVEAAQAWLPVLFEYNGQLGMYYLPCNTYTASENCPANHKDPDGSNYFHVHPLAEFGGFAVDIDGTWVTVTAAMSDAGWAGVYTGYTKVSGSTTAKNCYAFAVGAPVPTDHTAWSQWTTPYVLFSGASKRTSTLVNGGGHCVEFHEIWEAELIRSTVEKNASGPVWTIDWYAPFDWVWNPVYSFDLGNPIGKNLK